MDYKLLGKQQLEETLATERKTFKKMQKPGRSVDMTRGRPCKEQLDLAVPMLEMIADANFQTAAGDVRNYGMLEGLKDARELFANIFDTRIEEVIVADNSSLSLMYDTMQFAKQFGVLGSTPWNKLCKVKFICPAPGYDRHFSICEVLGIEMVTIPLLDDGPDMDIVEALVKNDESIKGIWCIPKYSNPTGITYSDKVVDRLATMPTAAQDFRIFWDNSYFVHSLYETDTKLKNIFDVAKKAGNIDRIYQFASTSKITFAGGGISAIIASDANIADLKSKMFYRTIGPNKIVQLAHTLYLKNRENVLKIMKQHAEILRPKFEVVDAKLSEAFADDKFVSWSKPNGGYFVSVNVKSCAKRIVELAKEGGVKFTEAGATYPYKMDDINQNIRIAPTVPSIDELSYAIDIFVSAIKIARMELVLQKCFS
ncbi:MAG TPA: aminotransferase class I/II-fold pyridoxal phosphate-dependent enzyme [Clostridia bacterium]|nr:aminotransferase class I/II-fold pyridoxal phosphate-dependent enzyme [Clostridia bacterium]